MATATATEKRHFVTGVVKRHDAFFGSFVNVEISGHADLLTLSTVRNPDMKPPEIGRVIVVEGVIREGRFLTIDWRYEADTKPEKLAPNGLTAKQATAEHFNDMRVEVEGILATIRRIDLHAFQNGYNFETVNELHTVLGHLQDAHGGLLGIGGTA